MNFFNYLFYRLYWLQTSILKEKDVPLFFAVLELSVLQGLNIIFIIEFFLFYILGLSFQLNKEIYIIIGLITFIIDFIYYKRKNRYRKIFKYFDQIEKKNKFIKDIFILIYVILTFILMIWLASEIREININNNFNVN